MKVTPIDIALNLYEIAGPIFVSLKEQVNLGSDKARAHPNFKELTFTQAPHPPSAIEYGKDQVGKLARSANVAQPAMSKIVDRLIDLGFARRDPHASDRRQIKLSLTPKGAAMQCGASSSRPWRSTPWTLPITPVFPRSTEKNCSTESR